jgi:hypothetical protein
MVMLTGQYEVSPPYLDFIPFKNGIGYLQRAALFLASPRQEVGRYGARLCYE